MWIVWIQEDPYSDGRIGAERADHRCARNLPSKSDAVAKANGGRGWQPRQERYTPYPTFATDSIEQPDYHELSVVDCRTRVQNAAGV